MRDGIFCLNSDSTCQICYNPINTRLMGSMASYDLFRFWLIYNDYYTILKQNHRFYSKTPDNKFYKLCRACYVNRRITVDHHLQWKTTGKFPYPREYSMTKYEIKYIWSEFIKDIKNKKWLLDIYSNLASIRRRIHPRSYILWHMYFNDIFLYFHNTEEHVDVYDLEEYETFQI